MKLGNCSSRINSLLSHMILQSGASWDKIDCLLEKSDLTDEEISFLILKEIQTAYKIQRKKDRARIAELELILKIDPPYVPIEEVEIQIAPNIWVQLDES